MIGRMELYKELDRKVQYRVGFLYLFLDYKATLSRCGVSARAVRKSLRPGEWRLLRLQGSAPTSVLQSANHRKKVGSVVLVTGLDQNVITQFTARESI
jgi:hypothetical protein